MAGSSLRHLVLCLAFATALGGCSSPSLEERATDYWAARQRADLREAYTFEDPRARGELEAYMARLTGGPLTIRSPEVESVDTEGDYAVVKIKVQYKMATISKTVTAPVFDLWLKQDGVWYHDLSNRTAKELPERLRPFKYTKKDQLKQRPKPAKKVPPPSPTTGAGAGQTATPTDSAPSANGGDNSPVDHLTASGS